MKAGYLWVSLHQFFLWNLSFGNLERILTHLVNLSRLVHPYHLDETISDYSGLW